MPKRHFDLHLLEIALALLEERSVSKVAVRLRMSQPAVSTALARLRRAFNDPLFVRTPRGMEPTPRAQALVGPAREIVLRADRELFADLRFDPSTTDATFTFALSDVGEMVFLPKVIERLQRLAPNASVRSVSPAPRELRYGLETGEIDLAIGYFPDLVKGSFYQQRLFTHHFTCLLRADHPVRGRKLTLKQFLELKHVSVRAEGRSQELFEGYLLSKGIHRKIVLYTPHFMSLPMTDVPQIVLRQHWHRRFHKDPRSQWLRKLMSELFSQASDEWRRSEDEL